MSDITINRFPCHLRPTISKADTNKNQKIDGKNEKAKLFSELYKYFRQTKKMSPQAAQAAVVDVLTGTNKTYACKGGATDPVDEELLRDTPPAQEGMANLKTKPVRLGNPDYTWGKSAYTVRTKDENFYLKGSLPGDADFYRYKFNQKARYVIIEVVESKGQWLWGNKNFGVQINGSNPRSIPNFTVNNDTYIEGGVPKGAKLKIEVPGGNLSSIAFKIGAGQRVQLQLRVSIVQ